jgi:hypothetical protein
LIPDILEMNTVIKIIITAKCAHWLGSLKNNQNSLLTIDSSNEFSVDVLSNLKIYY